MSDAARAEWARVVDLLRAEDRLTALDRSTLAAYCVAFAMWSDATARVAQTGSVVKGPAPNFYPMQSPYVAIVNRQALLMQKFAAELGLTASTRERGKPGEHHRVDLFGDPIPENHGQRGRPQHVATKGNRNKVNLCLALGWSNERTANALNIDPKTLRRAYKYELKFRETARDRLDARAAELFWQMFEDGSAAAGKQFLKLVERNDLMLYGQTAPMRGSAPGKAKEAKLGKKEQALVDAREPDTSSRLGQLMAARQQGGRPN